MANNEIKYTLQNEHIFPNARIRVFVPELPEEEQQRRFENLKKATARFLIAVEQDKKKREEKVNQDASA